MTQPTFDSLHNFSCQNILPEQGTWIGRVWVPASQDQYQIAGPHIVQVHKGEVLDLSNHFDSMSDLINLDNPVEYLQQLRGLPNLCSLESLFKNSLYFNREKPKEDHDGLTLLAPNDLMAVKACGVTFIRSLLERVIEEKARGDQSKADEIRKMILSTLGDDLSQVKPGTPETEELKKTFIANGMWSQYLEVGIGKDAEIFTKHQALASVSFGDQIGVLSDSSWNNPEPEIVIVIASSGKIVGATLGNDVNLRDYEGRSALLLGEAKDQNGSCSIGPFIRLFDDTFSLDNIKNTSITLRIQGQDGFVTEGQNKMAEISRSPEELASQAIGINHQYPDGLVLFLGTMFAPTEDRNAPGQGFTHHIMDQVEISSPELGKLVNWVNTCDQIPAWTFGLREWMNYQRHRDKIKS